MTCERVHHVRLTRLSLLRLMPFGGEAVSVFEHLDVVARPGCSDACLELAVQRLYGVEIRRR